MVPELKRRCNHFFSFNFHACGFVLVGKNSNNKLAPYGTDGRLLLYLGIVP